MHNLRSTLHVIHQDLPFGLVPSTLLSIDFGHPWGPGPESGEGCSWYRAFAEPAGLFTKGMQGKEKRVPVPVPPFFLKRPRSGEKTAGTNEFAFFRCRSICTRGGGVQNQAKKIRKMTSGRYRYQNLLFQARFNHSLRIYPYPMVWPLLRPWSETMVSIPL